MRALCGVTCTRTPGLIYPIAAELAGFFLPCTRDFFMIAITSRERKPKFILRCVLFFLLDLYSLQHVPEMKTLQKLITISVIVTD